MMPNRVARRSPVVPNTIPDHGLVVVADGGKALLFRRIRTGEDVTLREERQVDPDALTEQGSAGSRPKDQTPKQTGKASFANHLAHMLHTMHQHGDFKELVLVVDPQTLGQLRGALHKSVEAAVVRTVAKDLTNHPRKAIEAAPVGLRRRLALIGPAPAGFPAAAA